MNDNNNPTPEPLDRRPAWTRKLRELLYVLGLCRFSLLMVLGGYLLLAVDQGQDILMALAEDSLLRAQIFFVPVLYWGLNAWYWSRVMLDFRFPGAPPPSDSLRGWRAHLPRLLGLAAFLSVALNALQARGGAPAHLDGRLSLLAATAVFWGLVFYLFTLLRRRLLGLPSLGEPRFEKLRELRDAEPRSALYLLAAAAFGTFMFLAGWLIPVGLGDLLGAAVLYFLWAGTWIPLGSALVYWANHKGVPVLTGLLVAALVFSLWNDNHTLPVAQDAMDPAQRPTVTEAARAWARAHADAEAPVPFVVVATAGGGSRAAYWTATVLGHLEDHIPGFHDHLFAISGVSGGSVGATAYRAVLAEKLARGDAPLCEAPDPTDGTLRESRSVRECGQAVIGQDFLGPAVAGMLYPDLVQRFLPLPHPFGLPDRARALEAGFQDAFDDAMLDAGPRLRQSLLRLYAEGDALPAERSWPALFLNATWVQTGQRLIASNLNLERNARPGHNAHFVSAHDQLCWIGRDLRLATAADNSARFPGVGPAGTLRNPAAEVCRIDRAAVMDPDNRAPGEAFGRLVDGGYFENFGAVTAKEILATARAVFEEEGIEVRPIVIQVSSDPELPADFIELSDIEPLHFAYEARSILHAAFSPRGARGILAARDLQVYAQGYTGEKAFHHLRMCREADLGDPPLGWALSREARRRIDGYLALGPGRAPACAGENLARVEAIRAAFGLDQD